MGDGCAQWEGGAACGRGGRAERGVNYCLHCRGAAIALLLRHCHSAGRYHGVGFVTAGKARQEDVGSGIARRHGQHARARLQLQDLPGPTTSVRGGGVRGGVEGCVGRVCWKDTVSDAHEQPTGRRAGHPAGGPTGMHRPA